MGPLPCMSEYDCRKMWPLTGAGLTSWPGRDFRNSVLGALLKANYQDANEF
jgi:hypothetical protein